MNSPYKANLADREWLKAEPLQHALKALGGNANEVRIVGGAVRNALMGESVGEIDIATIHTPDETTKRAEAAGFIVHPTGISHGTVMLVAHLDGEPITFEVTTLRMDEATDGRRATVAFTKDWAVDAARRDFTINAIYCDAEGALYDPLGGLADINSRTVRFAGDPHERIREDYLRILRFFRFHAHFGKGRPDQAGLAACKNLRDGIEQLSAERIHGEIFKILIARRALDAITLMNEAGVLTKIFSTEPDTSSFEQMVRTDQRVGLQADAILRLAALVDPDSNIASRLRLSNSQSLRLRSVFTTAGIDPSLRDAERKIILYQLGADQFRDAVRYSWATSGAEISDVDWLSLLALADGWPIPKFPVTGADLLLRGYQSGPNLGNQLQVLEDWWIAAGFPDDKKFTLDQLDKFTN